jgi:hypothetical protein
VIACVICHKSNFQEMPSLDSDGFHDTDNIENPKESGNYCATFLAFLDCPLVSTDEIR